MSILILLLLCVLIDKTLYLLHHLYNEEDIDLTGQIWRFHYYFRMKFHKSEGRGKGTVDLSYGFVII